MKKSGRPQGIEARTRELSQRVLKLRAEGLTAKEVGIRLNLTGSRVFQLEKIGREK
jgi:DNA-binding CsgD family transcriptional regulator